MLPKYVCPQQHFMLEDDLIGAWSYCSGRTLIIIYKRYTLSERFKHFGPADHFDPHSLVGQRSKVINFSLVRYLKFTFSPTFASSYEADIVDGRGIHLQPVQFSYRAYSACYGPELAGHYRHSGLSFPFVPEIRVDETADLRQQVPSPEEHK